VDHRSRQEASQTQGTEPAALTADFRNTIMKSSTSDDLSCMVCPLNGQEWAWRVNAKPFFFLPGPKRSKFQGPIAVSFRILSGGRKVAFFAIHLATSWVKANFPFRLSNAKTWIGTVARDIACLNAACVGYPKAWVNCFPPIITPYLSTKSSSSFSDSSSLERSVGFTLSRVVIEEW
jgi:hypothetical protein